MPDVSYDFSDTSVVVTGASSGIGKRTAEQFAAEGADVAICSRTQENVDPVAEAINGSDRPGEALAVECDITDRDAVDAFVEATVEAFGGIDVLVNNAGAGFVAEFDDISPNGWRTITDINLTGTYNMTQSAGETLEHRDGCVINIASITGIRSAVKEVHYGAAKAGVINLTQGLAFEWARKGVRVNCVSPGLVATEILKEHWGIADEGIDRTETRRRVGLPEEISDVVRFLATPAASYVNGENIVVQGVPRVEENHEVPAIEDAGIGPG